MDKCWTWMVENMISALTLGKTWFSNNGTCRNFLIQTESYREKWWATWKWLKVQFTQKSKSGLIKELNQYFRDFCLWQQGCKHLWRHPWLSCDVSYLRQLDASLWTVVQLAAAAQLTSFCSSMKLFTTRSLDYINRHCCWVVKLVFGCFEH